MGKVVQRGFTLIELVVVIVILGILAATALPKFVDFQSDAAAAAVKGVAGAITAASAINYGKYQISTGQATGLSTANACSALITSTRTGLVGASLPSGYTLTTNASCSGVGSGNTAECLVSTTQGGNTYSASAPITCTG